MSHWDTLGIAPTNDRKTIKRTYSKLLKITRPEENPEGFQQLREAYEFALAQIGSDTPPESYTPEEVIVENKAPVTKADQLQPSLAIASSIDTEYEVEPHNTGATQTPSKDEAWSPWPIVDKVITPTYDENDEASLIILWKELINTDDFYNLDKKSGLEAAFLQALAHYKSSYYPVNLFIEIYNYYDWNNAQQYLQEFFEALDYLNARIHSALLYQEIVDTKEGRNKDARSEDREAAKRILAKKPPKINAFIHFFTLTDGRIQKYLQNIDSANPLIMHEELNTPTVKWWHEQFERTHLTFIHLAIAFILAMFPMDYFQSSLLENISISIIPIIYFAVFLVLSPLVFIAHIGIKHLLHYAFKPMREWVIDKYYASPLRQVAVLLPITLLAASSFKYPEGFYGATPIIITLFLILTQPMMRFGIITAVGIFVWVIFSTVDANIPLIAEPLPWVALSVWSLTTLLFWTGFEFILLLLPAGLRNWIRNDGEIYNSGIYSLFFIPMLFFSFKGVYLLFEQLEKLL